MEVPIAQHSLHSVLRERIVEHLLVGKLLQALWTVGNTSVEILRSEYDRGGYDLVADFGSVTRHVQLKCSIVGASAADQKISLNLAQKPAGCVIWVVVSPTLEFDHFLWFGSSPREPLPEIRDFRVAKHVKANAQGIKAERNNLRKVSKSKFTRVEDVKGILERLFGSSWKTPTWVEPQVVPAVDAP